MFNFARIVSILLPPFVAVEFLAAASETNPCAVDLPETGSLRVRNCLLFPLSVLLLVLFSWCWWRCENCWGCIGRASDDSDGKSLVYYAVRGMLDRMS